MSQIHYRRRYHRNPRNRYFYVVDTLLDSLEVSSVPKIRKRLLALANDDTFWDAFIRAKRIKRANDDARKALDRKMKAL